jgi:two-component system LytT family response regulator
LKPDVIFLDIQMPGESGFDLLEKIKINCRIIFVTAFDEYAIRAFEVNAQDYLLKPVNPERLATAIKRLETNGREDRKKEAQLNTDDCVFLELNSRFHFVRIDSILRISSAGDYSEIVTKEGKKGLVSKSLKEWEQRLPENMFVRIHRTSIVNLTMVDRIEDWFNYSYRVYLKGLDKPVVMSRRYAAKIKNRLK